MPDYNLYDDWINAEMSRYAKSCKKDNRMFSRTYHLNQFKEYIDYSIGFLTRGCFRKCGFCVNQKYDRVFEHSPLSEFYDPARKKICLLDDNFFGYLNWKPLLQEVIDTGHPYKFKQGMDERLLTEERCEMLFNSLYTGDYTFAFDNIDDYDLIQRKLEIIRKYTNTNHIVFYVLVGYKSTDLQDIIDTFRRIELLMKYNCTPYIMRYAGNGQIPWQQSEYRGMYITIARWCNRKSIFKKLSIREMAQVEQKLLKTDSVCAAQRYLTEFENKHPEIADKYFDMCFRDFEK